MDIPIKLSTEDLDYIIEGVTERLAQAQKPKRRKAQPAALRAFEAARNLGMSRARYYEVLKADHGLREAAITIGTKRLWPIAFLDDWLAQKQGCQVMRAQVLRQRPRSLRSSLGRTPGAA